MNTTKQQPFVHLFKTRGGYYIYDVNSDSILKISRNSYVDIADVINKKAFDYDSDEYIRQYKNIGLFSNNRVHKIKHPNTDLLKYYFDTKLHKVTLQVTQRCNLKCKYCAYSGGYDNRVHSCRDMDMGTAKKGIDFLIEHSADNETIYVAFYGGEPLLKFDMIKKCIEYAKIHAGGKKVKFNLTTNATLLNGDIVEYFMRNKVGILISLDGPREIQDKNRVFANSGKGTFDVILKKIQKIKSDYPDYYKQNVNFNAVLDPCTDFDRVAGFVIKNNLFSDNNVLATTINEYYLKKPYKASDKYISERNYEMFKTLLYELGKLGKGYFSDLLYTWYDDISKRRSGKQNNYMGKLPEKWHHSGPCIPGKDRLFVSVDGTFYPCERVSEISDVMKIGNVDDGIDIEKAKYILNVGKISEEQCKNCWAISYCYICAAAADNLKELSYDVLKPRCDMVRKNTENMLKDYCTLRELGHDFQEVQDFEVIKEAE